MFIKIKKVKLNFIILQNILKIYKILKILKILKKFKFF